MRSTKLGFRILKSAY